MSVDQALVTAVDRLTAEVKRVADQLEKQPSKGGAPGGKPVECYVCKKAGQSVQIRLRRKPNELIKDGQSPFDFFDLDGKPHVHVMSKTNAQAVPSASVPPQESTTSPSQPGNTKTAAANIDQIMRFLTSIWPNKDPLPVTDCGDHWRIKSPYVEDRDTWAELARQIRAELNGEYVSNKAEHEFYFRIPKPVAKL